MVGSVTLYKIKNLVCVNMICKY